MDTMLQQLQEDEEIAREHHMRLELYRLALQHQSDVSVQELDAVQAQIDAAFNQWRVAKVKLDESVKQVSLQPA